jgi:methylated-DNA-[protein]-cysteine S-methyltransferase
VPMIENTTAPLDWLLVPSHLGTFTLAADPSGLRTLLLPQEKTPDPPTGKHGTAAGRAMVEAAGQHLQAYLAGTLHHFDLPLSPHGTPFQEAVWRELRTIPYGRTMTYGDLAERVGGRQKARAVGGAAHHNPLAIVIPCHRLIGAGGGLTGFGGGLPLKQALLELEGCVIVRGRKRPED